MTLEGDSHIAPIQALRGIAAFMIVIVHLTVQTDRLGFPPVNTERLASGVDIFFIISGFIMWVTTARRPSRTARQFYRDRIARIVPLYWLITAFMVIVLLAAPRLLQTAVFDTGHVLASFLFFPVPNPANGFYAPLLIPGWTLNYEMFFYLLFGIAIALSAQRLRIRGLLILIALASMALAGAIFQLPGWVEFYFNSIILEFAFGIGLGMAHMAGHLRRSHWWWLVAALGVLLLASPLGHASHARGLAWGLPALMVVTGVLGAPPIRLALLEKLGDWSYSLYLCHVIVLSAAMQGWRLLPSFVPLSLFVPIALIACVLTAALLYRLVELPMNNWLKGNSGTRKAPKSELRVLVNSPDSAA